MRMKNPPRIKANLEELELSVAVAADAIGVTRQALHYVISGRNRVSPDMALRFEAAFGGTADLWLRMQAAYDLAQARQHGVIEVPLAS